MIATNLRWPETRGQKLLAMRCQGTWAWGAPTCDAWCQTLPDELVELWGLPTATLIYGNRPGICCLLSGTWRGIVPLWRVELIEAFDVETLGIWGVKFACCQHQNTSYFIMERLTVTLSLSEHDLTTRMQSKNWSYQNPCSQEMNLPMYNSICDCNCRCFLMVLLLFVEQLS
jgi:hypothetical protein